MLDADGCVWKLTPAEGEATEGPVRWMAETGMLDPYVLDAHYTNRLQIRLWLPEGSRFAVWAQYDDGDWQRAADLRAGGAGVCFAGDLAPVRPCAAAAVRCGAVQGVRHEPGDSDGQRTARAGQPERMRRCGQWQT